MSSSGLPDPLRDPTKLQWYVVQCRTREDCRALEHLERQGFSCYRPTLTVEKRRLGRIVQKQESLFPGYLFVQLDQVNDNWYPIRSTRGVIQIVRCRDRPLPVQDRIIGIIRARLANDRLQVPYLDPGERVVVTDGCFAHVEALFLANDGEERVMLLMNVLHREQTVSFPAGSVQKVQDSNVG
jgi:transcriptional antiterminator RfaH